MPAMCSVTVPASPPVVNAYYGNANGTTSLSTLIAAGATAHLTHLTYAFATSSSSNPCTGAPPSTIINSTDLHNLKTQNPNIKILISIGGESSGSIFTAALTPQNQNQTASSLATALANSCVATLIGSYPGYIDGIDVDWEYPSNTTDEQNFNLLLQAFRNALNTYAQNNGITEHLLLTAAVPPEQTQFGWLYMDFAGKTYPPAANTFVDFYNVEFYEYAYAGDGVTESNAPLTQINADIFGNPNYYGAAGLVPVGGMPVNKIAVGIPFYGVLFNSVTSGCQLGNPGTLDSSRPPYSSIQAVIGQSPSAWESCNGSTVITDTNGDAWSWNNQSDELYEYDNPTTIGQKASYASSNQLAGVFAWNLLDDTSTGTLLNSMPSIVTGYSDASGSVLVSGTSGLAYNKIKHTGSETFLITNHSSQTISGPIQFVLWEVQSGLTATNNSGFFNGSPYWTVSSNSLAPGAGISVTVTFSYTGSVTPTTTASVFSGAF